MTDGVYGEGYANGRGPAVRAKLFEEYARANDDNGRRITDLIDQVAGLEATMAEMANIRTNYHDSVDQMSATVIQLEGELKDIRGKLEDRYPVLLPTARTRRTSPE